MGDCVIELTNKTSWRVEAVLDWFRKIEIILEIYIKQYDKWSQEPLNIEPPRQMLKQLHTGLLSKGV